MEYMAKKGVSIESCLLSNYQTGTWTDISSHPVKTFLQYPLTVCLNTDDPGVSNNSIHTEFDLAKNTVGLNQEQVQKLQKNAVEMAFISSDDKARLLSS